MRVVTRVLVGIVLCTGCGRGYEPDKSRFVQEVDLASIVNKVAAQTDHDAPQERGGQQGTSTHRDRKFHQWSYEYVIKVREKDSPAVMRELRRALKQEIDKHARLIGENTGSGADIENVRRFGFTYGDDRVFGWLDVIATHTDDRLHVHVAVHESQL